MDDPTLAVDRKDKCCHQRSVPAPAAICGRSIGALEM
ncbi:hypothetical protein A2U01_0115495 [Trifolium medium]|uniref:Uncharacterized protein n=1 Tax=Trifolium medium TaxID=97028 RepID=A0A392W1N8_9FABA|nr:hypothetical protein [Trifolium medium]